MKDFSLTTGSLDSSKCVRAASSSKTSKACSPVLCQTELFASDGRWRDWSAWATALRADYSARKNAARRISASGSGFWPTPQVGEEKVCMTGTQNQRMLSHAVKGWPSRPNEPQYGWEPPRVRQTQPPLGGNPDGSSGRLDYAQLCISGDNRANELRLLGNGVVPATASLAFRTLAKQLFQFSI